MIKNLTCIECPKSCALTVDIENCRVVKVEGGKCPKGEEYAISEIESPQRILTSVLACRGLALRMVPVRTDRPIPKARVLEAASQIRKIKLERPVKLGEVIVRDFLGLGVNLIAARDCYEN